MKNLIIICFSIVSVIIAKGQELKEVVYHDGNQVLRGLITSNATADSAPGVLILPAWKGIDQEAKQAAIDLEQQGYIAMIADIYGEGNVPTDNASAAKIAGHYKTDFKAYQHRIALALEVLKNQGALPDRIAVIGYCFGGTGALEVARAGFQVQGVVCIHGGLSKASDRPHTAISTKVLVEHPAEDKSVSKADYDQLVVELNAAKADWQIITYAHCGHTFTNPLSADYNPVMAERAWKHTLIFLDEVLR